MKNTTVKTVIRSHDIYLQNTNEMVKVILYLGQ